jgi:alpha-N-acetylglucosamine transferase
MLPISSCDFTGMAFNKLRVFQLTQFRKLLWVDADSFVFHNIDHLLLEPPFSAAVVQECMLESEPLLLVPGV